MRLGRKVLITALLLALIGTTQAWRQRKNTDKAVLFETFPQLNTYEDACVTGTNHMLIQLFEYPYGAMTDYSFHAFQDMGSYSECEGGELGEKYSEYVAFYIGLTHLPFRGWGGLCLPKECTQANFDFFTG